MASCSSEVRIVQNTGELLQNAEYLLPYFPTFDPTLHGLDLQKTIPPSDLKRKFLDHILKNPSKEIFQRLKDALRQEGMTKLCKILDREVVKDEKVFNELVRKNSYIMNRINWDSILNYYYEKKIIQLHHKEDLKNACSKYKWTAVICYFSTMDDWFFKFLKCLKDLKEREAVQTLSPLFLEADSDESLRRIVDEFVPEEDGGISEEMRTSLRGNSQENIVFSRYLKLFGCQIRTIDIKPILHLLYLWKCISWTAKESILEQENKYIQIVRLMAHLSSERDGNFYIIKALQECKERSALHALGFDLEDDDIAIEKKIAHFKDMGYEMNPKSQNKVPIREEARSLQSELETDAVVRHNESAYESKSEFNFLADDELPNENLRKDENENTYRRGKYSDSVLNPNKLRIKALGNAASDILSSTMEIHKALEPFLDHIKNDPKGGKCITTKEDGVVEVEFGNAEEGAFMMEIYQGKASLDISYVEEEIAREASYEDEGLSSTDEKPGETFKIRNYQKELAQHALTGGNCIIVAPTGSGKTHVAIYIIKEHFKKAGDGKVLFVVPTVALVEQQKKQVQKYCNEKVIGLSGSSDLALDNLMNSADVFVLTPQILLNQLQNDQDFLMKLSLIVFDECHHTNKDHPYNSVMSNYLSIRYKNKNAPLPQIVGLTASIGVGKAKTMKDAVNHVTQICANLDCPNICIVIKHLKELQEHINKPDEETIELNGRSCDPFYDVVNKIMEDIEKKMNESPEKLNAEKETKNFVKDIKSPPSERGNDPYIQWLSRIKKSASTIHRQNTRMFYITMIDYLTIYNNSLIINADCRTKDALNYIEHKIRDEDYSSLPLPEGLNESLVKQWKDKYENLRAAAGDKKYDNPKLEKMKHMISDYYKENSDSRCIIFCKTREMATALVNWMNETPELQPLNPTKLVGTNAPANREGMTSVQQDDVLKYFRNGEHKVIIATSVAEEGLDVQKCNIVIRYEHVTNSIARVQTRGRARKDNAKYVLVAERGRGASEKEEKNAIREEMMKKAINEFQSLGFQERKSSICKLQREALISKSWSENGKQMSKDLRGDHLMDQEFELRCIKCDQLAANSVDIKKIQDSHHVIIDPSVRDRIEIRPHPKSKELSKNFATTGKIYCSKCKLDWGIMAIYKNVPFPVIKVSSFVVKSGSSQTSYKQWKQVPFSVATLTLDDLREASETRSFPQPYENSSDESWNKLYLDDDDEDTSLV